MNVDILSNGLQTSWGVLNTFADRANSKFQFDHAAADKIVSQRVSK